MLHFCEDLEPNELRILEDDHGIALPAPVKYVRVLRGNKKTGEITEQTGRWLSGSDGASYSKDKVFDPRVLPIF